MKKLNKTLLATFFAGVFTLGAMNMAQAISPQAQEALAKSQISASQALSAAQSKIGAEAQVKEVEFHHTKYGKDYFQVELFANNQKHQVDVDAANGEILGSTSKAPKSIYVHANESAPKISFEQAIKTAEEKTGGKVAEAELKQRNGQGFYKIETVANGQEFKIAVNAENGQIMDMPMKHKGDHKEKPGKHHRHKHHQGGFQGERSSEN